MLCLKVQVFIIFTLFIILINGHPLDFVKFTRVACKSSGKTCPNTFCKVVPLRKNASNMNFGCDLQRSLNSVKVNFSSSMRKSVGNFRQIITLNNLDVCEILKNIYKFPHLVNDLAFANKTLFPGAIHECPYNSIKVYNASMSLTDEQNVAMNIENRILYPNGVYKNRLAFYDDLDENIAEITYFFEVYSYVRTADFK